MKNEKSNDLLVEAKSLVVEYPNGIEVSRILDNVDLSLRPGEFTAIVGVSGSGKTTLLNVLGGIVKADSGSVKFNGIELEALTEEERILFRRRNIAYIFQNYNLISSLDVFQNICLSAQLAGMDVNCDDIKRISNKLHFSDKLFSMPSVLAGVQQQRVAIARAMLARPKLLLADEPTGNLYTANGNLVMNLLQNAAFQENITVLMVTHNESFAKRAERVLRIKDGKLVTAKDV